VRRRWLQAVLISVSLAAGTGVVAASVVVPVLLLVHADDRSLTRWSEIGIAVSPVGVFFSGAAFIGITVTLFMQRRELQNQREELGVTQDEQVRSSEVTLRQLHTDVIRMAIEDPELRQVWPGATGMKRDLYCNLILNLQKVAYEMHTIEAAELRSVLRFLMGSHEMHAFWGRARAARVAVTGGDEAEDIFTAEVDRAFEEAIPVRRPGLFSVLRRAVADWRSER
jgi:hypothetical protein